MITETLGIKTHTKKSEIGAYFTKIENTMKIVKGKLGKIVGEYGSYPKEERNRKYRRVYKRV